MKQQQVTHHEYQRVIYHAAAAPSGVALFITEQPLAHMNAVLYIETPKTNIDICT